jgi:hypothetical protein
MANTDLGFLRLRNLTAHQPDGNKVPPNHVLTTGVNGASAFSNNVLLSTIRLSTLVVDKTAEIGSDTTIRGQLSTLNKLTVAQGGVDIYGATSIEGLTSIIGNLSTAGNVSTSGLLSVSGKITGNNGANITAGGLLVGDGGADITGAVTLRNNVSASGAADITGLTTLRSGANITAGGLLVGGGGGADIAGNTIIRSNLSTLGTAEITGLTTLRAGLNVSGSGADISGTSVFRVSAQRALSIDAQGPDRVQIEGYDPAQSLTKKDILINPNGGKVAIGITDPSSYTFRVNGTANMMGTTELNGALTVTTGGANVTGNSFMRNNLSTTGTYDVGGLTNLRGNLSTSGTCDVGGLTNLRGSLITAGNLSTSGTCDVAGATNLRGNLSTIGTVDVGGLTNLRNNLSTSGILDVGGAANLRGNVNVTSGNVGVGYTGTVPTRLVVNNTGITALTGLAVRSSDVYTVIGHHTGNVGSIQATMGGTDAAIGTTGQGLALNPLGGTVSIGSSDAAGNRFRVVGGTTNLGGKLTVTTGGADITGTLSTIGNTRVTQTLIASSIITERFRSGLVPVEGFAMTWNELTGGNAEFVAGKGGGASGAFKFYTNVANNTAAIATDLAFSINGDKTIQSQGKLTVASGGASITGELTVTTGGLNVSAGGAVINGGLINYNSMTVFGGLTIGSGGATINGSATIRGGANIYDGATIQSGNLSVSAGNATVSGTMTAGEVALSSDQRIKTNVNTLANSLSTVKQLRGVSYNLVKDNAKKIGLIAQEVEQIIPEVVLTDDTPEQYKSVAYGNIVAVLIEAVKELSAKVESLEKQISA